jgi:hypothetical protein
MDAFTVIVLRNKVGRRSSGKVLIAVEKPHTSQHGHVRLLSGTSHVSLLRPLFALPRIFFQTSFLSESIC